MAFNSLKPSLSSTPAVLNLIIINVIVYIAQQIFDASPMDPGRLTSMLALYSVDTGNFKIYQLVTHLFAHGGFLHILFNMYALWLFGSVLERGWGAKKFLIFYFACGFAAGLSQMFLVPYSSAIGASGAVMGLIAAFAYTYPNVEFYIIPIPFPIKVKWLAVAYAAIDIFGGLSGKDGIAHFAHLGGLVMGLILVFIWNRQNKKPSF
ncbi:MAG: rhomboid family intramembrane serine protease [Ginsengibacter sp.]